MATETDLVGLGVSPLMAQKLLGFQPTIITAIGTVQSGASTVQSRLVTVQAATGATAIIIAKNSSLDSPIVVANPGTIGSAAPALVFVPVGHTLNNGTNTVVNQPYTLPTYSMVYMWQTQIGQWYSK
jgi:hypothetical protein